MAEQTLPGIETIQISELTELAEKYEKKRDARVKLLAEELILKAELIMMLDNYKLDSYRDGDLVVYKTLKENCKVKRENHDDEQED